MADLYEISNPSDAYTIQGEREAVCGAVLLLGEGLYPVSDAEGVTVLPPFAFSRDAAQAADDWWQKTFGRALTESLDALTEPIAGALESVLIGSAAERSRMERVLAAISSPEDREKAKAAWHDERRTSQNDIGARAAALAKHLRAKEARRAG